jgi:prepilin-type N-terminal cleavage/methylation domain-containing protein
MKATEAPTDRSDPEERVMRKHRQKGFTLMELMVVIVIVAILAAVAVPLYINYVKDAQRTEAKGAIGAVITAEQTYFQVNPDHNNPSVYANMADGDFKQNPGPTDQKLNCDLTEALNNWKITVVNADDAGFDVVAEGIDGTPAAGLKVTYHYLRSGASTWEEE